jgi:predicted AAA+ superfamily ATPase
MYSRLLKIPFLIQKSFFLFGPRGTGKTAWVKTQFPQGIYLDLLESNLYTRLLAYPQQLEQLIPKGFQDWIILDEVQKIPALLNEVHRLIEKYHYKFVLTGSSARSLRKKGVNLLAGRALTFAMYPLTVMELGEDFDLQKSLTWGHLPSIFSETHPEQYLHAYVKTYLREEVLQEGLTRNIGAFSRFLEIASFSQGSVLNISEVSRESGIERKVIENYFTILEDLLLSFRLPVFTKRAKRRLIAHPKFYYFDVGVFRAVRPMGPLDRPEEAEGPALETLFIQEVRAINDYQDLGYECFYWRTQDQLEIDLVLYGKRGIYAFEIKRSGSFNQKDLRALTAFSVDYPEAHLYFLYGGTQREYHGNITVLPLLEAFQTLSQILTAGPMR